MVELFHLIRLVFGGNAPFHNEGPDGYSFPNYMTAYLVTKHF